MKNRILRALVLVAAAATITTQVMAQPVLDDVNFSQISGTCNAASEGRAFWVKDNSTASGNCAAGGGSKAICICDGTNFVVASGSGGGTTENSFETINAPSGTDPVADGPTDTLNVTCTVPLVCTGTAASDTMDFTIDSTDASKCARFDASGLLVPATGDCAAGDTDTDASFPIVLDLDNDGSDESTSISEIADTNDRYGITEEPSANLLLFDWTPVDDRYLTGPPSSAGTIDDEFNGSIKGGWTVVDGASGTVDMHLNSSGYNVYDTSTRSGWVLFQVGSATGDDVLLRQDYELPDGSSVVVMFAPPSTSGSNGAQCGIGINDNDTAPLTGNYIEIIADQQAAGARALVQSGGSGTGTGNGIADDSFGTIALAITRVDSGANKSYAGWASFNGGASWQHVDTSIHTDTLNNFWLYCDTRTAHLAGQNDPIIPFDWVREKATTNLYTLSY